MSAITLMELYQDMGNKAELGQMKKKLHYYDIVHVDSSISIIAIELIENSNLSHGLQIPDALSARQRLFIIIPLYTYNIKDFNFMPNINIYTV